MIKFKERYKNFISTNFSEKSREFLLRNVSKILAVDLLKAGYHKVGVLNSNPKFSGEENFLKNELKSFFLNQKINSPIIFDVGANVGSYSKVINKHFPNSEIYCFEPNPNSFNILKENTANLDLNLFNFGFSNETSTNQIFSYKDELHSSHTSLYNQTFKTNKKEFVEIDIELKKLDDFLNELLIDRIDFLKIDTEGHELSVLEGANENIRNQNVSIIQFEFNELNVYSRSFLLDFYKQLESYEFFRINTASLEYLGDYDPRNEIFQFQNILAINKQYADQFKKY